MASDPEPPDEKPVPRLPRGRGWGFSTGELFRIAMIATLLVAVIALRKPCSESVGHFMQNFEPPVDAGPAPAPEQIYVHCDATMTPEQCIDKLKKAQESLTAPDGSDKASAPGSPPAAPDRSPR